MEKNGWEWNLKLYFWAGWFEASQNCMLGKNRGDNANITKPAGQKPWDIYRRLMQNITVFWYLSTLKDHGWNWSEQDFTSSFWAGWFKASLKCMLGKTGGDIANITKPAGQKTWDICRRLMQDITVFWY
jgi:hypothetical protein